MEDCLQMLKCVSFWLHSFCGWWEGWDPVNRVDHTGWVAIVTLTDSPGSVRNRNVIEVLSGVFVLSRCFWGFSVGVLAFVIGLSQIFLFILLSQGASVFHKQLYVDVVDKKSVVL